MTNDDPKITDAKIIDTTQPAQPEDDTAGHSLLLDTDYYIQRKPRGADTERGTPGRHAPKEIRGNKPERRH